MSLLRRRGVNAANATVVVPVTGSGTVGDPYILTVASHLQLIRDEPAAYFGLGNDIGMPAGNWAPVDFTGYFDGHGYVIDGTGATLVGPNASLFGFLYGTVRRLGIENLDLSSAVDGSGTYKGTFARSVDGLLEDCYCAGGTVETGGDRAGGMGGITASGSTWRRCYSAQSRSGAVGGRTGGIGGFENGGTLTSLYFDSDVWGSTDEGGGGGVGVAQTTVQMQQEATFSGWDFTNVWQITEGSDYPRLRKGI